jgi:hypothetical protein
MVNIGIVVAALMAFSMKVLPVTASTDVIVLKQGKLKCAVSKMNGSLIFVKSNGNMITTGESYVSLRDVADKADWSDKQGKLSSLTIHNGKNYSTVIVVRSYGKAYRASVRYTLTSERLRWDVTVFRSGSARECNIDFVLPVSKALMTSGFWAADGAPFDMSKIAPKTLTYRQWDIVMPFVTLYDSAKDVGVSIVSPLDQPKPGLEFDFGKRHPESSVAVSNIYMMVGGGKSASASILIVPHQGDWRCGLAWVRDHYGDWFKTSPTVMKGEGRFMIGGDENTDRLKLYATLGPTWFEFTYGSPFHGLYFPKSDRWATGVYVIEGRDFSLDDYESGKLKEMLPETDVKLVSDRMHFLTSAGIQSYMYLTSFECWIPYADRYFPQYIATDSTGKPTPGWIKCYLMNPDPSWEYGKHVLDQVNRFMKAFPEASGVFLDQSGYQQYDYSRSDGYTMIGSKPVYSLTIAQTKFVEQLASTLHANGRGLWINGPFCTEIVKNVDGVMVEGGPLSIKTLQYFGIDRPMVNHSSSNRDERLKQCLVAGIQVAISEAADAKSYEPLFEAIIGRKWFLYPHALELPRGTIGNIFQVPSGDYVVVVARTVGDTSAPQTASVESSSIVRVTLPNLPKMRRCYELSSERAGTREQPLRIEGKSLIIDAKDVLDSSLFVISKDRYPKAAR